MSQTSFDSTQTLAAGAEPGHGDRPLESPSTLSPTAAESPQSSISEITSVPPIPLSVPSWLISSLLHLVVILLLALLSFHDPIGTGGVLMEGGVRDGELEGLELSELQTAPLPDAALTPVEIAAPSTESLANVSDPNTDTSPPLQSTLPLTNELSPLSEVGISAQQYLENPGNGMNMSGVTGRQGAAKQALLESAGGTPGTEAAVQRALEWLARHQSPDGSWSFQPEQGQCGCPNPGAIPGNSTGATALALLPFLGAGHTHEEGEYREVVKRGLYYLRSQQDEDGSLWEVDGRMYSHALSAIAMCEAYAMTQDRGLRDAAQLSLDFITIARDPTGGGWRYSVGESGDTSVTGWIVMAMKSGRMGYLSIQHETVEGARTFLDSVQGNDGATYGYKGPGDRPSTSAVGLLCRMYMGWSHDHPSLERGVLELSGRGPSKDDIYYDYYATQVLRHYGGSQWEKWNLRMRGYLVGSQHKYGHAAGSWFFPKDMGAREGGRLYCTAMAAMILEVYYRHLPIYGESAANDHFPL